MDYGKIYFIFVLAFIMNLQSSLKKLENRSRILLPILEKNVNKSFVKNDPNQPINCL